MSLVDDAKPAPEPGSADALAGPPQPMAPETAVELVLPAPGSGPTVDELCARDLQSLASPWGSVARVLTVAGLLGFTLVLWANLTFDSRWVTKFLTDNDLEMPLRMRLIKAELAGAGAGVLLATIGLVVLRWRKVPVRAAEIWAWWLAPALLLPSLPILFRFKPWVNRHEFLLPATLVTALLLEVLLSRSFASVPGVVSRLWGRVVARVGGGWRRHIPTVLAVLLALFYGAFSSFYTLRWHYKIHTHLFDLGINTNLLYSALHGKQMWSPLVFPDDPGKYIANHAKFGQYLILPFFWLFPRAETLLVAQSVALGLATLPLYGFARRRVGDWTALLIALSWICYYPMQSANFYETNYIMIGTLFVIATVWAADAKRWWIFGFVFFWGLISREDMPVGMAIIGAMLLITGHRPKLGLMMAVVSSLYFLFIRFYWMNKAGDWFFPDMYKGLWSPGEKGFKSVIKTLLVNPTFVLGKIVEKEKLWYVMHLLVPLAFLPARRWWLWAAFLPGIIITLLVTDMKSVTMYSFQYVAHWAPLAFLATALALASIRRTQGTARMRAAAAGMLLATLVTTYNIGAFPRRPGTFKGGYFTVDFEFTAGDRARLEQLNEIIKIIPPDAPLAATEQCGAHVTTRIYIYTMRNGPHNAEYMLASSKEMDLEQTRPKLKERLQKRDYGVIKTIGEFAVFKKGADPARNDEIIRDWKL